MTKKKKILISLLTLIVIVGFSLCIVYKDLFSFKYISANEYKNEKYIDNFENKKSDFNCVVGFILEDKQNRSSTKYMVSHEDGRIGLYNPDSGEDYIIPQKVEISLSTISEEVSARGGTFSSIDPQKNKISFLINQREFAYVYSLDGEKPTRITSNDDEDLRYHIEDLGDGWCSVSSAPPL